MNDLKIFNEKIYEKYLKLYNDDVAMPNLVSSKRFLEKIKKHPILFIGQETNSWLNYYGGIKTLDEVEDGYDSFIIDENGANTHFWRFIKQIIDGKVCENVVWTNTILYGKRASVGAPNISKDGIELSLENLLFLYEYFEPSYIINVSGNRNPYYQVAKLFYDKIGSKLKDTCPVSNDKLKIDGNIFWTYHPNYLVYRKGFREVTTKIKELIKK